MSHQKSKTMKHEHDKSQQVQTRQRLWKPLVVACQTTKARHPGKTALHDPAPGQQDEAPFGLGQLDDFQTYPMFFGCLAWFLTGVTLINKGKLNGVSSLLLYGGSQLTHLSPILLIGRGDMQGQQMTKRVYCRMHLASFAPLGSIIACSVTACLRSIAKFGCQK